MVGVAFQGLPRMYPTQDPHSPAPPPQAITKMAPATGPSPDRRVREEAAARFAAGDAAGATRTLLDHLTQSGGQCPKDVWYLLMDMYQATGHRPEFERLAAFFAHHFGTTPPPWEEDVSASPAPHPVLQVDGALQRLAPDRLRQFLVASRAAGAARLDLSRTRLKDGPSPGWEGGCQRLLELMVVLRRHRVPTLLMGETQLAEALRSEIVPADAPASVQPCWLLLLEFLQWRGQQAAFEELAHAYTVRQERSPPDFDPRGAVAQLPTPLPLPQGIRFEGGRALLPTALLDADMEGLLAALSAQPAQPHPLVLPLRAVRHMTYSAAVALASFLHGRGWGPDRLVAQEPSEPIAALFDMAGVTSLLTTQARKR